MVLIACGRWLEADCLASLRVCFRAARMELPGPEAVALALIPCGGRGERDPPWLPRLALVPVEEAGR